MRHLLLIGVVAWLGVMLAAAQDDPTAVSDREAITQTMLDYLEGWYDGNAERMARALHPALVKRGLIRFKQTGRMVLNPINAEMMIELSRAGLGKLPPEERKISLSLLDITGDIASVKATSAKFIDYVHLARQEGRWRIVNVLWVPNDAPPPKQ